MAASIVSGLSISAFERVAGISLSELVLASEGVLEASDEMSSFTSLSADVLSLTASARAALRCSASFASSTDASATSTTVVEPFMRFRRALSESRRAFAVADATCALARVLFKSDDSID